MQETETLFQAPCGLRQLDPSRLPVGTVLPGAIYDSNGDVLLRSGWKLRSGDIGALTRRAALGLFGGQEWFQNCVVDHSSPTPSKVDLRAKAARPSQWNPSGDDDGKGSRNKAISLDTISPGSVLASGLYSKRGILLLGEGLEVTPQFLDRLRQHGIFEVHVDARVHAELSKAPPSSTQDTKTSTERKTATAPRIHTRVHAAQSPTVHDLDRIAQSRDYQALSLKNRHDLRPQLPLDDFRDEAHKGRALYQITVDQVEDLLADMSKGTKVSMTSVRKLLNRFVGMIALDGALLPSVTSLWDSENEYLAQHSVNVSLLSMTAAARQGLPPDDVREIGLGAMLQDVGMLKLPYELRHAPRTLTEKERELIHQHPYYSVAALEKCDGVSGISMMIAYQSHERPDRSGYPRGHHGMFIHPYARIVAAADAFDAVCSKRPYREAISPYKGMEFLLRECKRGHFDGNVIRNFLDSLSLFPVGTYVRLSDGRNAKVLRANPGEHTNPVVLPLGSDGFEDNVELDLLSEPDLEVVEAYREHPSLEAD